MCANACACTHPDVLNTYICIYVCVCVYMCMCVCIYIYTYIYMISFKKLTHAVVKAGKSKICRVKLETRGEPTL